MLITVGAFDGFHKGHSELLRLCRENSIGDDWGVVTFYPHPSEFIGSIKRTLFTLQEKELIRRVLGIPKMYVLKFDDEMMRLPPRKFWSLLRGKLNVDGLVMGSDFHFGFGRSGNAESLREMALSDGVNRIVIADLLKKPEYSSSCVRENITSGNVRTASEILGYPFFMMSRIIHGNERGRTIHFPTANLEIKSGKIIPSYGVYASAVLVNNSWYCGALSIGNNPTFHDVHETRAEVYIMDFDGDIYGNEVMIMILERLRGIITFDGKEALMKQIAHDTDECRKIYGSMNGDTKKFLQSAEEIYCSQKNLLTEILNLTYTEMT